MGHESGSLIFQPDLNEIISNLKRQKPSKGGTTQSLDVQEEERYQEQLDQRHELYQACFCHCSFLCISLIPSHCRLAVCRSRETRLLTAKLYIIELQLLLRCSLWAKPNPREGP